ncbi:MAG: DNA gyrase subunit A, partial [Caldilineaceae bacterium]|nr:DNA gyrase subunit A [Caldilineaceae bacterium]
QRIEDEYQEIMTRISYLEDLLAHPEKIRGLVRDDILDLKERFGDERRTAIAAGAGGEFNEEDLIAQENVLISFSAGSYIKRMPASEFRAQGRGGRGIKGMSTRQEDEVIDLLFARTLDDILFFTNKGRVYSSRVYELPEGSRTARGAHIANLLSLLPDETVSTMLIIPDFEQADYVTLLTRMGRIKRMELSAFSNIRTSGLIAMNLDPADSLDWARLTNGGEDFIIVTQGGKSLRFREDAVRPMGRTAAGVMAIRLLGNDEVISMDVVKPDADLLVLHTGGYGKRVSLHEYAPKGRYTQGIWTTDYRRLEELGPIVSARVVQTDDQITVITSNGIVMRTPVAGVSQMGRSTRGVRIVNLQDGDSVAALAVLGRDDLERKVEGAEDAVESSDDMTAPARPKKTAVEVDDFDDESDEFDNESGGEDDAGEEPSAAEFAALDE